MTTAGAATIAVLALGTIAIKAAGPIALGTRRLPPRVSGFIGLLAPALLTALVAVDTFGAPHHLVIDARAAGLLAAGGALLLRAQIVVVVVTAAVATALVRLVS